jgi:uncharacterized protein YjbI with pentapeptide repeats
LSGVRLSTADLTGAMLVGATLIGADLRGANLTSAEIDDAYLAAADLDGARGLRTDLSEAPRWSPSEEAVWLDDHADGRAEIERFLARRDNADLTT